LKLITAIVGVAALDDIGQTSFSLLAPMRMRTLRFQGYEGSGSIS
jgi:hypothetical protein